MLRRTAIWTLLGAAVHAADLPARSPVKLPVWALSGPLEFGQVRRSRGTFRGVKFSEPEAFGLLVRTQTKEGTTTFYVRQGELRRGGEALVGAFRRFVIERAGKAKDEEREKETKQIWRSSILVKPSGDPKAQPLLLSLARESPWVMVSGTYTVAEDILQDDPTAAPTVVGEASELYRLADNWLRDRSN